MPASGRGSSAPYDSGAQRLRRFGVADSAFIFVARGRFLATGLRGGPANNWIETRDKPSYPNRFSFSIIQLLQRSLLFVGESIINSMKGLKSRSCTLRYCSTYSGILIGPFSRSRSSNAR
jgi:hypothetical protein